jgi:hypothetical protein
MEIGRTAKMILALAAIAVIMMFSEMRAGTLLATIIGAGLILLGLASYYRPGCMAGLMITAGSAAISNNPGSLTVVASWLNAVFGILIPVYILTWVSLNSAYEESNQLILRSRASAYTLTFMLACLLSVPIAALILGLVAPTISTAMSVLTEIAIMLTVVTAGLILLTSMRPRAGPTAEPEESPE